MSARPTSDRVREAVFDILGGDVGGKEVLDLFAGSGAMGIEALSRGARRALFVEKDSKCCGVIRENLRACRLIERAKVYQMDAFRFLAMRKGEGPFDLIFVDPPYARGMAKKILLALGRGNWLHQGGKIVLEHSKREALPSEPAGLLLVDLRRYGDTRISIYVSRPQ